MVNAGKCGFCETCFILASIATLAQSRSLLEASGKPDISKYDPRERFGILDNTDAVNSAASFKFEDPSNNIIDMTDESNSDIDEDKQAYDYGANDRNKPEKQSSTEGWCVVWYLGAFGSLVCFFLIITCMELFFRMPLYRQSHLQAFMANLQNENKPYTPESPPPPYHLFAPPGYEETVQKTADDKRTTRDIFVIPVYPAPPVATFPSVVQHL